MTLDDLDRRILDSIQRDFPIDSRPFHFLAWQLGSTEEEVLGRIERMQNEGVIRKIGPVFDARKIGFATTLCAAKVDPERVDSVAEHVNRYVETTHNYLREHDYNLWFTLTVPSEDRIEEIIEGVRSLPGVRDVASLPAEETYKIRVQFQTFGEPA